MDDINDFMTKWIKIEVFNLMDSFDFLIIKKVNLSSFSNNQL